MSQLTNKEGSIPLKDNRDLVRAMIISELLSGLTILAFCSIKPEKAANESPGKKVTPRAEPGESGKAGLYKNVLETI